MIRIESLCKRYGSQLALDNVSVSFEKNQITGLIGPNGAGKSTLMKIVCGYMGPSTGSVFIDDEAMEPTKYLLRRKIGYLPENNPLYYDLYVKEYLAYVAGIYKLNSHKTRVAEVIARVGLEKEQHKKIGALSKGYKQRVGLAQAILHDPGFLVLDEPTSGLDPNQIVEIRNLIVGLGKNKTVLLSTHILQEVEAICDQVVIISNGRIVANENTDAVRGGHNRVLLVEFDKSPPAKEVLAIEGVAAVENIKDGLWAIETNGQVDIRPAIFKFAVDHNIVVLSQQYKESKLEDIFQQLTKKGQ